MFVYSWLAVVAAMVRPHFQLRGSALAAPERIFEPDALYRNAMQRLHEERQIDARIRMDRATYQRHASPQFLVRFVISLRLGGIRRPRLIARARLRVALRRSRDRV